MLLKYWLSHIRFEHNDPDTSMHRKYDTWLRVDTFVYDILPNGKLFNNGGCHYVWKTDDFKLTKFSFKLLETIMYPIANHTHNCTDLMGLPISNVIFWLKKKKINFDDVLKPLAGV